MALESGSLSELEPADVEYPESDGEPMAETDLHRDLMVDLIAAARYRFRDVPDVYVSGNLFVYYVKGNVHRVVAPDFFAVRGVPKGKRRIYKVWEEGRAPQVVIELTSRKTHREDCGKKRAIYEKIGVEEYFLFDPYRDWLDPPLRGYRRDSGGRLVACEPERRADGALVLRSRALGLDLVGRDKTLRFVDPATGERVPTPEDFVRRAEDAVAAGEAARRRAEEADQRAEAADQRA